MSLNIVQQLQQFKNKIQMFAENYTTKNGEKLVFTSENFILSNGKLSKLQFLNSNIIWNVIDLNTLNTPANVRILANLPYKVSYIIINANLHNTANTTAINVSVNNVLVSKNITISYAVAGSLNIVNLKMYAGFINPTNIITIDISMISGELAINTITLLYPKKP